MQFCVYITALQYGCETVEAKSEDEAKQEIEKLFKQHRISWHDEEITDISLEEVYHERRCDRASGERHYTHQRI